MLILGVPAVMAVVLFMSSVSTQAMEFADRPGPISGTFSSPTPVHVMPSEDRLRRQISSHIALRPIASVSTQAMEFADRPGPISGAFSSPTPVHVMPSEDRLRRQINSHIALRPIASVSTQAMEFADRPGPISGAFSSPTPAHVMLSEDRLRRQINSHIALRPTLISTKAADRPNPISNVNSTKLSRVEDGRGRLSAEFSAVSEGSGIRFEHWPWVISTPIKPIASPTAMRFENCPGPISNRFRTLAAGNNKVVDRPGFTSSLARAITPFGLHVRPSAVEFCVGSIAPCGPLSFAQRLRGRTHESKLFGPFRADLGIHKISNRTYLPGSS